jgi:hypothetical protein
MKGNFFLIKEIFFGPKPLFLIGINHTVQIITTSLLGLRVIAESQRAECKGAERQCAEPNAKVPNVPRWRMYQHAKFTNVQNVKVPNVVLCQM